MTEHKYIILCNPKQDCEDARVLAAHLADCMLNGRKPNEDLVKIALGWLKDWRYEDV